MQPPNWLGNKEERRATASVGRGAQRFGASGDSPQDARFPPPRRANSPRTLSTAMVYGLGSRV